MKTKTKKTPERRKAGARNVRASLELVVNDPVPNDSDKTFVVPAGQEWEVMSIMAQLISDATVGNRVLRVEFLNAADEMFLRFTPNLNQAASLTHVHNFARTLPKDTTVIAAITHPLPEIYLPAGYKIRVWDFAAIAATLDDLTVRIVVQVFRY